MKEWFTAAELAAPKLPGMPATKAGMINLAKREDWRNRLDKRGRPLARRRKGRGGGWEYHIALLPLPAREGLLLRESAAKTASTTDESVVDNKNCESRWSRADWAAYDRLSAKKKATAERRRDILERVAALAAGGVRVNDAVYALARESGVGLSTIYEWRRLTHGLGRDDWLPALAPRHAGRAGREADCDAQAWEFLKADYLRPARPTFESCYERLKAAAGEHGWTVPSSRTLRRRLEREVPRAVMALARDGRDAAKRTYPHQERDRSAFHALEAVNVDGHVFDVFVRWPDGRVGRPVMVALQDLGSGKLLAWRVGESESAHLVQLAFGDLFQNWGIPDRAWLDNGRGFASKWITGGQPTRNRFKVKPADPAGILTMFGVEVHWTTPYSGQSKPIERAFRDLADHVSKHPAFEGAYTGNRPDAKPENYRSRAVPFVRFVEIVNAGLAAHNARPGRRTQACAGELSFDQAFEQRQPELGVKRAAPAQLRMFLMVAERVRARKPDGAIRLLGNRYWSPLLTQHIGRDLTARFDPDDLYAGIEVYRLDGSHLGFAECWEAAGFADVDKAREHNRAWRQYLKAQKSMLDAIRTLSPDDVAALMPDVEPPAPPARVVVRLAQAGGAAAAEAADPDDMTDDEYAAAFSAGLRLVESDRERE